MKIIQIFIAMLIFASPAFGVTVRCSDEGNGVVRIDYDATDENALPLAFALDITVDNGATIEAISGYKIGDSTANEPGFGIFPRSLIFDDGGRVADRGFPDVKPDADTEGVKPGLGTSGLTIEMGSRYSGAENAPLKNDMLFKINVNNHGAQEINVTIAPNIAGGGVVLEDAALADVTAVGCTLTYSETVPQNSCRGDINNDGAVNGVDFSVMLSQWGRTDCSENSPCSADLNDDGSVNGVDFSILRGEWGRVDCLN